MTPVSGSVCGDPVQPAMALNATTRQPITLELMRGSPHRRRKELVIRGLFLAAALLGLVISVAIVLALAGQAIRWLLAIDLGGSGRGLVPPRRRVRPGDHLRGDPDDRRHRDARRGAARPRRRRLPLGVRESAYATRPETDPGDAREHPERGPRVLRLPVDQSPLVQKLFASAGTFNFSPGDSPSGSSRSRSSPRWRRTRCMRFRVRCARRAYGIGAQRKTVTTKVVFPFGGLGVVASLILGFSERSARRWSSRSRQARPAGRCEPSTRSNAGRR